jgi:hypothetical protein
MMSKLTIEEYLGQHGAGHEDEITDELRTNAALVVARANELLSLFGEEREQRSGWRPQAVNDATPNAAHHSMHITCQAIDLEDSDRRLTEFCTANKNAQLVVLGLYMENAIATPDWVHVQIVAPGSGQRVYFPNAAWAARALRERLV